MGGGACWRRLWDPGLLLSFTSLTKGQWSCSACTPPRCSASDPKQWGTTEPKQKVCLWKSITSSTCYDNGNLINASNLQPRNSEFLVFKLKITVSTLTVAFYLPVLSCPVLQITGASHQFHLKKTFIPSSLPPFFPLLWRTLIPILNVLHIKT